MKKYVYLFSEGNKDMRNLLGGKGANLAEMTGKLFFPIYIKTESKHTLYFLQKKETN